MMKRLGYWPLLVLAGSALACAADQRPKILGIDHVVFYTTSAEANQHLYSGILGLAAGTPLEDGAVQHFVVGTQWVAYRPAGDPQTNNRLDHVALTTDDVGALRRYLEARGVKVGDPISVLKDGSRRFNVSDPEGHKIEFVERAKSQTPPAMNGDPVSRRIIHAGFTVRDRAAEDRFYRDILGFHLYWYGGMQPERTDWVAMQTPEGTDWLEYMLNVPAQPDLRITGVLNHFSLGVREMKQAQAKLESHGWTPHGNEHAQMGRDGKWQLNVFDPDLTRIELMEFKPAQKPCCSEFQGQHPQEP
ncbi:MAG: VOC family protein [Acidobacteria bacterium]|nr:VOC family protein [Acidobacteriota bacterium]